MSFIIYKKCLRILSHLKVRKNYTKYNLVVSSYCGPAKRNMQGMDRGKEREEKEKWEEKGKIDKK